MGLSEVLARLAVRATRVLVVEVPGHWATRVKLEQHMLHRSWRPAWSPADADVLAVCGTPGPELAELVDRLWEQMPGPRIRTDITSSAVVSSALDDAATLLLDISHHRADARERAQEPRVPEDHGQMDHGGHEGMDHSGHGGMDMAPESIPLAQGGEDRDGLEMDILRLPLGPVLPFWPAGLVLRCSLQGDVVVEAEASVVDADDHGDGKPVLWPGHVTATAVRCDNAVALLALAGVEDSAACARRTRDAVLRGDRDAARDAVERLHRTVRRSRLLRWSLRGVLQTGQSDLERHGLPDTCRGDAYDRLLSMVERVRIEVGDGDTDPEDADAVPWEMVPHLVTGLELASVRLAVASLDLHPFLAVQEAGHA